MYRLVTFGGLNVERDGVPLPALAAQRKAMAVLAVVAASGAAGVPRDRLLSLLWPESDSDRARGALKQMLHSLRRQMGPDEVLTGTASVSLNPVHITSDIVAYTLARRDGRPAEAVVLYAGPFLDGVHIDGADELEHWFDARRQELARDYAAALEELARTAESVGDWTIAVEWWRRRQSTEPLSSRVAVALMRALHASGDGPAALRHARVHEALVQQEFGSSADTTVATAAAAITAGESARVAAARQASRKLDEAETGNVHTRAVPADDTRNETKDETKDEAKDEAKGEATDKAAENAAGVATLANGVTRVSDGTSAKRDADRHGHWRNAGALGLGLTAAALLVGVLSRPARIKTDAHESIPKAAVAALEPKRVAITVFENETGDSSITSLGLMASDWISRGLTRTALVDVLDVGTLYTQHRGLSGERIDPRELARRSGAGLVVDGRYYKTADTVRFTARVVDVATGRVLRLVDPISAPAATPLAAVDELRQRVTTALGTIIDPRASFFTTSSMQPPRLDAYEQYVIAQDLYWRGAFGPAFEHFRRATELDPAFDAAAAWLTVNAAGIARCDIVDSVASALSSRTATLGPWEQFTISVSKARCASDWVEHNRLQRARLERQPHSSHVRWTLAAAYRQLGAPGIAAKLLTALDPERDLAWMSDDAKLLYWRELTADHHALGAFASELAIADRLTREARAPLAAVYIRARALAGAGRAIDALSALDDCDSMLPEPALVAGLTGGWMRAPELATPGWVMYQIATELAAHGAPASASLAAAERAVAWFARRALTGTMPPEQHFVHAHSLVLLGRAKEGQAALDTLLRTAPENVGLRGALGVASAAAGDHAAAQRISRWLATRSPQFPVGMPTYYRASIAAMRGDTASALELLEALPHGAHPYDLGLLHSDPAFAAVRGTARFQRLVAPRPFAR